MEICCRDDPKVIEQVGGKIIEAGGPEGALARDLADAVFTYREIMELVLRYTGLRRLVLSLPYWIGMVQAFVLEKLPESIFTLTRAQVSFLLPCQGRLIRPGEAVEDRQYCLTYPSPQLRLFREALRSLPFLFAV